MQYSFAIGTHFFVVVVVAGRVVVVGYFGFVVVVVAGRVVVVVDGFVVVVVDVDVVVDVEVDVVAKIVSGGVVVPVVGLGDCADPLPRPMTCTAGTTQRAVPPAIAPRLRAVRREMTRTIGSPFSLTRSDIRVLRVSCPAPDCAGHYDHGARLSTRFSNFFHDGEFTRPRPKNWRRSGSDGQFRPVPSGGIPTFG